MFYLLAILLLPTVCFNSYKFSIYIYIYIYIIICVEYHLYPPTLRSRVSACGRCVFLSLVLVLSFQCSLVFRGGSGRGLRQWFFHPPPPPPRHGSHREPKRRNLRVTKEGLQNRKQQTTTMVENDGQRHQNESQNEAKNRLRQRNF